MYPSERNKERQKERKQYICIYMESERECAYVVDGLCVREIGADLLRQRHVMTEEQQQQQQYHTALFCVSQCVSVRVSLNWQV